MVVLCASSRFTMAMGCSFSIEEEEEEEEEEEKKPRPNPRSQEAALVRRGINGRERKEETDAVAAVAVCS
jgi:hypothetical protein